MRNAERTAGEAIPGLNLAPGILQIFARAFAQLRRFMPALVLRRRERRLSICELLPLGEKRFVAVVQVDRQQFLIGGAPNSVALLAQLPAGSPASAGGGNAGTGIS